MYSPLIVASPSTLLLLKLLKAGSADLCEFYADTARTLEKGAGTWWRRTKAD